MEAYWQLLIPNLILNGIDPARAVQGSRLGVLPPGARVLIAEADPGRFLDAFFAALIQGCHIWLADHRWGAERQQEILDQVKPHIIFTRSGSYEQVFDSTGFMPTRALRLNMHQATIMLPTGGSQGGFKFAIHTWDTLTANANAFIEHYKNAECSSLCVLPLYHVSGLMQVLRAILSGGQIQFGPLVPETLSAPEGYFLSLVPTQLGRLLKDTENAVWLKRFKAVFVGGAALSLSLAEKARELGIPLAPCYGMTETAAMVSLLDSGSFLKGKSGVGYSFPDVDLRIQDAQGEPLPANEVGEIVLKTPSIALAYFPDKMPLERIHFSTGDRGFLDEKGGLHVQGRGARVVNTGGESLDLEDLERRFLQHPLVEDIYLLGEPSEEWGEMLIAALVLSDENSSWELIRDWAKESLSAHEVPKKWHCLESLPRSEVGKIQLEELRAQLGMPH